MLTTYTVQKRYETAIEPHLIATLTDIQNQAGVDVVQAMRAVKEPLAQSTTAQIGPSFDPYIVYELKLVLDKL
jgi:hypothetical protein